MVVIPTNTGTEPPLIPASIPPNTTAGNIADPTPSVSIPDDQQLPNSIIEHTADSSTIPLQDNVSPAPLASTVGKRQREEDEKSNAPSVNPNANAGGGGGGGKKNKKRKK